MNTEYMRVADVAEKLGLTDKQIYRRIHDGRLHAELGVADGKSCYLIPTSAVDGYVDGGLDVHQPEQSQWLRPAEVGRFLGYSTEQVRRMVTDGELPARRNGQRGHIRIPRAAVERLAAERDNSAA